MDESRQMIASRIAANITVLRTGAKMTQLELAEKLNYSDKSVSKWERADGIPDVIVLKQIADLFGVTLDYLIEEHSEKETVEPAPIVKKNAHNRRMIEWLSIIGAWTAATLIFVVLWLAGFASKAWLVFVLAVPVSAIISLVFKSVWGTKTARCIIISLLIWSLLVLSFLTSIVFFSEICWQVFILGVPAQAVVILAYNIKRK